MLTVVRDVQESRQFPAEMVVHDKEGLRKHMEDHPKCEFCGTHHFGSDELFEHLRSNHFWCTVCHQLGQQVYFPSFQSYSDHLRRAAKTPMQNSLLQTIDCFDIHDLFACSSEHFRCMEPECSEAMIAFPTIGELRLHSAAEHLGRHGFGRTRRGQMRIELIPPDLHLPRGPRVSCLSCTAQFPTPLLLLLEAVWRVPCACAGRAEGEGQGPWQ